MTDDLYEDPDDLDDDLYDEDPDELDVSGMPDAVAGGYLAAHTARLAAQAEQRPKPPPLPTTSEELKRRLHAAAELDELDGRDLA